MKPDDEALISFYYLGYTHGMRFSVGKFNGGEFVDRPGEKFLIDLLPPEVSALRLGADPLPAVEKISALVSKWKETERKKHSTEQVKPRR